MEGVRQPKYSILNLEEDKVMEGDHTEKERNEMQIESQIARGGCLTLPSEKGKRANVQNTKLLPYPAIPQFSREDQPPNRAC